MPRLLVAFFLLAIRALFKARWRIVSDHLPLRNDHNSVAYLFNLRAVHMMIRFMGVNKVGGQLNKKDQQSEIGRYVLF